MSLCAVASDFRCTSSTICAACLYLYQRPHTLKNGSALPWCTGMEMMSVSDAQSVILPFKAWFSICYPCHTQKGKERNRP
eukprot:scaffold111107_cov20-Tisochrysis_lutea.AAC.4